MKKIALLLTGMVTFIVSIQNTKASPGEQSLMILSQGNTGTNLNQLSEMFYVGSLRLFIEEPKKQGIGILRKSKKGNISEAEAKQILHAFVDFSEEAKALLRLYVRDETELAQHYYSLEQMRQGMVMDELILLSNNPNRTEMPKEEAHAMIDQMTVKRVPNSFYTTNGFENVYLDLTKTDGSVDSWVPNAIEDPNRATEDILFYGDRPAFSKYCMNAIVLRRRQKDSPAPNPVGGYVPQGQYQYQPLAGGNVNTNTNIHNVYVYVPQPQAVEPAPVKRSVGGYVESNEQYRNDVVGYQNQQFQQPLPQYTNQSQEIIVRNKPNWVDVGGLILKGVDTYLTGVNTYRGVRLEDRYMNYNQPYQDYSYNYQPQRDYRLNQQYNYGNYGQQSDYRNYQRNDWNWGNHNNNWQPQPSPTPIRRYYNTSQLNNQPGTSYGGYSYQGNSQNWRWN